MASSMSLPSMSLFSGGGITTINAVAPISASTVAGVTTLTFDDPATLNNVNISGTLQTIGSGVITGNIIPG